MTPAPLPAVGNSGPCEGQANLLSFADYDDHFGRNRIGLLAGYSPFERYSEEPRGPREEPPEELVPLPGPSHPTLVMLPGPSPREPPARPATHAQALEPEPGTWTEPELTPRPSHRAGGREPTPEPPVVDGDIGPNEGQASPPEYQEAGPEPELILMPAPLPAVGDSGPCEGQADLLVSPEEEMRPDSPANNAVPEMGPSEDGTVLHSVLHSVSEDGTPRWDSPSTEQPGALLGRDADGRLLVTIGVNADGSRVWGPLLDPEHLSRPEPEEEEFWAARRLEGTGGGLPPTEDEEPQQLQPQQQQEHGSPEDEEPQQQQQRNPAEEPQQQQQQPQQKPPAEGSEEEQPQQQPSRGLEEAPRSPPQ